MLTRRQFLAGTTCATVASASAYAHAPSKDQKRPNILFCLADDVSFPHMGAYGCKWVRTPGFDRVAREGLLFSRAYTPNAKCAPSRACILTGRNSWQLEAAANHWCYFPSRFTTFTEALAANDYVVGFTAKGWGPGVPGEKDGKPRQLTGTPFNSRRTKKPSSSRIGEYDYAGNFEEFLKARPAKQPFFFWYGGLEPHRGYEYQASLTKAGRTVREVDAVPRFWPDNETVRTDILDYAYEIEHFDSHLVRMLDLLENSGELENTIVVVTADNGMPFPRAKGQAYDYSNHMPLAIMWKNGIIQRGRTVPEYVSFIDFAPTFLEVAGVSQSRTGMEPIEGVSLTELFAEAGQSRKTARSSVLIGKERHDVGRPGDQGYPIRGIVKDDFVYLCNFEPTRWPAGNPETGYLNCDGSPTKTACIQARRDASTRRYWEMSFGKRPGEELYDLRTDRDCMQNLAGAPKHADRKKSLREELFARLTKQGDPRVLGSGDVFDRYPYADEGNRNFYERFMRGEKLKTGWVNPSDFDTIE